jgi:hypothetical protein
MVVTLVIGLLMTAVAGVAAGRRIWMLNKLIRTGQPAVGRTDGWQQRLKAELVEVLGQSKLLKWSIPGIAHFFTFWGFLVLATVYLEAYGALFDQGFAIPLVGTWAALGFLQDFFAVAVLVSIVAFAICGFSSRRSGGPEVTILRFTSRWRLADPVHDFQRDLDAVPLPRREHQHRALPVRGRRIRLTVDRSAALAPLGAGVNEILRTRRVADAHRRDAGFLIIVSCTPSTCTSGLAPVNVLFKRCPKGARPVAADVVRRQADRLRGPGRRRHLRARQDRGLHLEGHARLRHLHRVRALPEPVPGLEHRQAAVAQARDHGPARPPVREGAVPACRWRSASGRHRSSTDEEAGPVDDTEGLSPASAVTAKGPARGGPLVGTEERRRHRPRRAVVLHDLRRLRRAVPGRHRARRPHRRHAPLPGADRVGVPVRGRRDAQATWRTRATRGAMNAKPAGLDQGPATSRSPGRRG